jgi:hypothetical protein
MVLPLTTAGANNETKPSKGHSSGQQIPMGPDGQRVSKGRKGDGSRMTHQQVRVL